MQNDYLQLYAVCSSDVAAALMYWSKQLTHKFHNVPWPAIYIYAYAMEQIYNYENSEKQRL